MVLTGLPDPQAHAEMVDIMGLPVERFEELYWADRHAYDEGKLTGIMFWENILRNARLDLGPDAVQRLNAADARMWTTHNPRMVAWQAVLKQQGIHTAILSNMGDSVLESISKTYPWIQNFDVLVWSFQLRMAKPDPAIYLHTLERLGLQPHEALFLDDKQVNVDAAIAVGMKSLQFSTVDKLRTDLVASGFDRHFPLPD